ncbi:hypothetical protein F5051DRAFT_447045 [Lentinula edodes]|nr:hypothetical protein F5051DRAFT_447045 [Lentinula edodes]
MSTSRTATTTQPAASTSSRPANLLSPGAPIDEDEDEIIREALARKAAEEAAARKAAEEAEKKKRAVAARHQAAQDARDRAIRAREQEDKIVEWRRKLAEAATARSQGGNSMGDVSASPRRPIVEISQLKSKGKGKAKAQPVGEDPDDDDDEDREPCERCRSKKIPCLKQAGVAEEGGRIKSKRRASGHTQKSNGADPRQQSGLTRGEFKIPAIPPSIAEEAYQAGAWDVATLLK